LALLFAGIYQRTHTLRMRNAQTNYIHVRINFKWRANICKNRNSI